MVPFISFVNKSYLFYIEEIKFKQQQNTKVNIKCAQCFYKLFNQRKVREKGKTKTNNDAELPLI